MGLRDRIITALAGEISKNLNISPIATPVNPALMQSSTQSVYNVPPLERSPLFASNPFPSGNPLNPNAINPPTQGGRPQPRKYEFDVAENIKLLPTKLVPFTTLRTAADQIDIIRRCIEVRKAKLTGLDWDIVLSDSASERIIAESGGNHLQAMAKARESFAPEIARLRSFWETPDPANGLNFTDWLSMAIEEMDVLDALAIFPQQTVGGKLRGLQIIDGATIKPLIDDRGMRPEPEYGPAYQQILYGFPRTEFVAGSDEETADGTFRADELAYLVRNRRANSIWGYSPTERSLQLASIYLLRQQWLRGEFTDGVMPKSWVELPESMQITPENLKFYENIYNDDLAGQLAQRNRARFILPGGKLQFEAGYAEKFNPGLDDFLITGITGNFGVLPTELGYSAKAGLGGSGHQKGESESAEAIGVIPTARWLSQQISMLSYRWLGMPRELEFRLAPSESNNNKDSADRDDVRRRNGTKTLNEGRADLGLPLLDSPEADMPILVAGQSVFLFGPDGLTTAGTSLDENGKVDETQQNEQPQQANEKPADQQEVAKFIRWASRDIPTRPFNFEHLDHTYAERLNKFIEEKDVDGAIWFANRYLGK